MMCSSNGIPHNAGSSAGLLPRSAAAATAGLLAPTSPTSTAAAAPSVPAAFAGICFAQIKSVRNYGEGCTADGAVL